MIENTAKNITTDIDVFCIIDAHAIIHVRYNRSIRQLSAAIYSPYRAAGTFVVKDIFVDHDLVVRFAWVNQDAGRRLFVEDGAADGDILALVNIDTNAAAVDDDTFNGKVARTIDFTIA